MAVKVVCVRGLCPAANGDQDFTVSGFGTCVAAFFILSGADTDGTVEDTAQIGYGATDGTRQWCMTNRTENGVGNSDDDEVGMTDKCICAIDEASNIISGEAAFTSFITDGVRVTWAKNSSKQYFVTAILFGGEINVRADVINLGTATTAQTYSSMGFEANLLICAGPSINMNDTITTGWQQFLGFVHNNGAGGITQRCIALNQPNNSAAGAMHSRMMEDKFGAQIAAGAVSHEYTASNFTSSGFDFTSNANAGSDRFGFLAIDFPSTVGVWVGSHNSPTANGDNSSTAPGFKPQFLMLGLNACAAVDADEADGDAGIYGVSTMDGTRSYCNAIADEFASATLDTQSVSNDQAIDLAEDAGVQTWVATFSSFNTTGWTLNFTAQDGVQRKWIGFAIQESIPADSLITLLQKYRKRNSALLRM